jgi:hypothetical protein
MLARGRGVRDAVSCDRQGLREGAVTRRRVRMLARGRGVRDAVSCDRQGLREGACVQLHLQRPTRLLLLPGSPPETFIWSAFGLKMHTARKARAACCAGGPGLSFLRWGNTANGAQNLIWQVGCWAKASRVLMRSSVKASNPGDCAHAADWGNRGLRLLDNPREALVRLCCRRH